MLIGSRGTGRDPGQDGMVFSRSEATLYERLSVRPSVSLSVHMYVMLMLFGLLGATYAVYMALLKHYRLTDRKID